MDRSYLELVECVRMLIVAVPARRVAALSHVETHPLCTDALRDAAEREQFSRMRSLLSAMRPRETDRSVLWAVDAALAQNTRAGRRVSRRRSAAERPGVLARPAPPPAFASGRKTVLDVEGPIEAIVPFHERLSDVQRWIARPSEPLSLRALPDLEHGTDETAHWKLDVREGVWECPWPGCPQPRMILRVGEERVPHVAHVDARTHGTDADWVMATMAALQAMSGHEARTITSDPLIVRLGGTPFLLAASTQWNKRLAALIEGATQHVDERLVVVLRAVRLPKRVVPVLVHQEDRPRWGMTASDELVDGLSRARRVIAAPEPPNDDPPITPSSRPVWGSGWLGLGLEATERAWLDWRETRRERRRPVVALELGSTQAAAFFTTITGPREPAAERWWPSPGADRPKLPVGDRPLLITCAPCANVQLVKPMTDQAFDALAGMLDAHEAYAALEANAVGVGIYERCPGCGGPVGVRDVAA